jgi:hypothetical protein
MLMIEIVHHVIDSIAVCTLPSTPIAMRVGPMQQIRLKIPLGIRLTQVDVGNGMPRTIRCTRKKAKGGCKRIGLRRIVISSSVPEQPVAIRGFRMMPPAFEPRVSASHVLKFNVHVNFQTMLMRRTHERQPRPLTTILRRNIVKIGGEIIVIKGRWLDRRQQNGRHAKAADLVEPVSQSIQITDPISIAVAKTPNEHVIKNLAPGAWRCDARGACDR